MESSKKPSSSSSSPDSTLEDPFKEDAKEHKRSASTTSLPKVDQDPSQSTELSSDKLSTTESPPTQVMDQSSESSYRIPSSVFARSQSMAPAEWSVTSNESLFSIHTGNMSFTKDPAFWRSGELGLPGEPSTSGQMFNYSGPLSPGGPPTDLAKGGELAVETMKEVLIENAQQQCNRNNQRDDRITRQESCHGSTKSFAFPILAGDAEKVHSVTINGSVKAAAPAPAPAPAPEKAESQAQAQAETPAKAVPAKAEPPSQPETKKPKSTWTKWFPCFTRCRICS